ncbi:MAG TPA: T9SS type A sorting domain-containing protein [Mucilaginibacter sp.]|jgi:hypothetical protein
MRFFLRNALILGFLVFSGAKVSAQSRYDWTGAISTDWSNPANWESTASGVTTNPAITYPGPADTARVGVVAFTNTSNFPVISSGGATSVGSIVWGTENYLTVSLVVNTAFTVNGNIDNTDAVPGNGAVSAYVFSLSGTGTMTVTGSLNVGYDDGFTTGSTSGTNNNTFSFDSSINHLVITGNINLNAFQGDTKHRGFLPAFNALAGTVTVTAITSSFSTNVTNSLFNASLTVGNSSGSPAATLQLTGATALTTFTPYINNYLTFNNPGATVEYSGASQTVYTDAAIPNLSNTISYYSIKFSGTGAKIALSGNLLVAGDFTNSMANDASNYVSLSAPTVNFNGTTQNLYGGIGNGTTFYNVDCSNSGTKTMQSGTFSLADIGILTMSGSSTKLAAGSGIFTLISDAVGTASVAAIPSGCSITGTVNSQRYFQGSTTYDNVKMRWLARNYRIISSPVNNGVQVNGNYTFGLNYIVGSTANNTSATSTTNAYITGCLGGTTTAGNPSSYVYKESKVPYNLSFTGGNFPGITNITNSTTSGTIGVSDGGTYSLPIGTGVFFFFRGAATNFSTRTNYPFIAPENVTFTSTGYVNQGSYTYKDWYTPLSSNLGYTVTKSSTDTTTNYAVRGFNMLGNPYPCSIDWNTAYAATGISRTKINPTIWVFNPVTNQYDTYLSNSSTTGTGTGNATSIIASGQGFFVQASGTGASLVINETAKSATSQPTGGNLLMGTPVQNAVQQNLRLKLTIDSLNYDDIVIGFNSNASVKYNGAEDAQYLPGINAMEGLSSFSADNVPLAINYLPLPKQTPEVIKLDAEGWLNGSYTLQRTALDAVPQLYEVWLMDNYKKDSLDLRNNSTYVFDMNLSDTNSYGKNRFQVVIRQNPALGVHLLNFAANKSSGGAQVVWKTENEQNYTNFTVERSSDGGTTFDVLGGISSSALGTYSFLDANPPLAADQYRLKIEDLNGAISYSNIVTLIYGNSTTVAAGNINVYPNPASNVINLAIKQSGGGQSSDLPALQSLGTTLSLNSTQTVEGTSSYNIKIISITGSVISNATSSESTWQNDVSGLTPGTYIIEVVNNSDKSLVGKSTFVKL